MNNLTSGSKHLNVKFIVMVLASIISINLCYASDGKIILSLKKLEHYAQNCPSIKEKRIDVISQLQKIKVLRAESSAILQSRLKGGYYTHFTFDGIPRGFILKPKLGFKYYLFGGNKYMEHIIDQEQPLYYKKISELNRERSKIYSKIASLYLSYWKYYFKRIYIRQALHIRSVKICARRAWSSCRRFKLSLYTSKIKLDIIRHKIENILHRRIPFFIPLLDFHVKHRKHAKSLLSLHPGIAGLISYYHSQRRLGWLKFVDVKIKAFIRPSYYPQADMEKWAFIGGIYVNMPIDIFGAVKHEDQRLSLDREKIMLKLQNYTESRKQAAKIRRIQLPAYKKEISFWSGRRKSLLGLLRSKSARSHLNTNAIDRIVRSYRIATDRYLFAEVKRYKIFFS